MQAVTRSRAALSLSAAACAAADVAVLLKPVDAGALAGFLLG